MRSYMRPMLPTSLTSPQSDITEAVRSTALLADVSLSMWLAERTDRSMIDKLKEDAGAVGNVGRAIKNLLAGADQEYKAAKGAFMAVRQEHYGLTLPWVSDPLADRQRGPRLLPTLLWDRYIEALQTRKRRALEVLDTFIDTYPQRVQEAMSNLGGLANPDDYPNQTSLRSLFRISFDFEPVPAGAHFRGLPQTTLDKLDTQLRRRQEMKVEAAQHAMWSEVRDRMNAIAERAGVGKGRLRQSAVDAVQELVQVLPGWNVTGDPRVAEIVEDIRAVLNGKQATALREDKEAAVKAGAVLEKLSQWGL